jgi:AcrR family transcriptional regulator
VRNGTTPIPSATMSSPDRAAGRGTNQRGVASRAAVLDEAIDLASQFGLDALSMSDLAGRSGMSKSGVHELFGSKEALQLAALEHGRARFRAEVVDRIDATRPHVLRQLTEAWFDYLQRGVFPGGCFLTTVSFEFHATPGAVRDRIVVLGEEWLSAIARCVEHDQRAGVIRADVEPRQLAFEVRGVTLVTNWAFHLGVESDAIGRGRRMVDDLLRAHKSGAQA